MKVFENRASVILYKFLKSNNFVKPFLLPANVCPIVVLTFHKSNVPFVFVDINDQHCMDLHKIIQDHCLYNYSGMLFVHAYGRKFDNEELYRTIKLQNEDFVIIDDKCLCPPKFSNDLDNYIDLELFSTGYSKYIELSYGGWGLIRENFIYNSFENRYNETDYTSLMHKVSLSLKNNTFFDYIDSEWLDLDEQIDKNEYQNLINDFYCRIQKHKHEINGIYLSNIDQDFILGEDYIDWRFMLKFETLEIRNQILSDIFVQGFFAGTNYPSVSRIFNNQIMKNAEKESNLILNLFNDFRISAEDAYRLSDIINECKK